MRFCFTSVLRAHCHCTMVLKSIMPRAEGTNWEVAAQAGSLSKADVWMQALVILVLQFRSMNIDARLFNAIGFLMLKMLNIVGLSTQHGPHVISLVLTTCSSVITIYLYAWTPWCGPWRFAIRNTSTKDTDSIARVTSLFLIMWPARLQRRMK